MAGNHAQMVKPGAKLMPQPDGVPLYHQLKEIFLEKIIDGEWQPGQIIPPETQLCEQYGVSRGPIRQALDLLVREGLLTRKQGKGTWVLHRKIERGLGAFYSFTTLIEDRGLKATARLLIVERVVPNEGVAHSLDLCPGALVVKICRLRFANEEPLILETIYIPDQICPGLTEADLMAAPLYTILSHRYRVALQGAKQFFEPVIVDEYEARMLQVSRGAPALLLQNVTYAVGSRPIMLSKAIMRGDRVRYYVELPAPIQDAGAPLSVVQSGF